MCEHFGVGLAGKDMAAFEQARAQSGIVFDDAVVNDRDAAGAVHVRMGVCVGRTAVRGPTRVPDPDRAAERLAVVEALGQARELALGLGAHQRAVFVDDGDSGAIVAAVLEAA